MNVFHFIVLGLLFLLFVPVLVQSHKNKEPLKKWLSLIVLLILVFLIVSSANYD